MLSTGGGFSPTIPVSSLSNALSDFDPKHHVGALPCRSYQPIESRIMIMEDGSKRAVQMILILLSLLMRPQQRCLPREYAEGSSSIPGYHSFDIPLWSPRTDSWVDGSDDCEFYWPSFSFIYYFLLLGVEFWYCPGAIFSGLRVSTTSTRPYSDDSFLFEWQVVN